MLRLHPEILVKNGKKEFVILTYEEFVAMQERLADAEDLIDLRNAKRAEGEKATVPLAEVKRQLGTKADEKARRWRVVFDYLKIHGATTPGKALGCAAIKKAIGIQHPDFEGMWERGFIEWLQKPDGNRQLWHCYAAVDQLPADPIAAPVVRDDI